MGDLLGLPDRRWLELALVFNFQPAAYLHDTWLEVIPHGSTIARLRGVPRAVPRVSRYVLESRGLDGSFCEDFGAPLARLALLDGDSLQRLFLYLGLALRSNELKSEIVGARVRDLKQAVGSEPFVFVLNRAPFLGALPEFPFEPEGTAAPTRFLLIGARYCAERLARVGDALMGRLALKLPYTWSSYLDVPVVPASESGKDSELPLLVRKLIKEVVPQWNPLFA